MAFIASNLEDDFIPANERVWDFGMPPKSCSTLPLSSECLMTMNLFRHSDGLCSLVKSKPVSKLFVEHALWSEPVQPTQHYTFTHRVAQTGRLRSHSGINNFGNSVRIISIGDF